MRIDFDKYWYRKSLHPLFYLLLPFSWLFGLCVYIRRSLYRAGLIKARCFSVPVIVVGNITVGGTGKTPFIIWLAKFLQSQGYKPGIVSRGVGGKKHSKPHLVMLSDAAKDIGDEAILLRDTGFPVMLGIDRAAAVESLLQLAHCNIILSDDGLQHYGLARDMEIVLVDDARRFGNEYLLPVGPLRESITRLNTVDFLVANGGDSENEFTMELIPGQLVSVSDQSIKINPHEFLNKKVHAVAGIGNPDRFFITLKSAGFNVIPHVFPDHYLYQSGELEFGDSHPVIMTEKDAVKCREFANNDRYWFLSVIAKINSKFEQDFLLKLKHLEVQNDYEGDFEKSSTKCSCNSINHIQHNDMGRSDT